jgi:hypothetical protein
VQPGAAAVVCCRGVAFADRAPARACGAGRGIQRPAARGAVGAPAGPWKASACSAAAKCGHLELLKWLRRQGCPWDATTCSSAARSGHLAVLRWAHQQGCPWDGWMMFFAAYGGNLAVLQWAHQQGCPLDASMCISAAEGGHLEVLRWARESGVPWNQAHCVAVLRTRLDAAAVDAFLETLPPAARRCLTRRSGCQTCLGFCEQRRWQACRAWRRGRRTRRV